MQRFFDLFKDQIRIGLCFANSMIAGYTAVVASPGFLYVDEKPGKLDDFALATRLPFPVESGPDERCSPGRSGELASPKF